MAYAPGAALNSRTLTISSFGAPSQPQFGVWCQRLSYLRPCSLSSLRQLLLQAPRDASWMRKSTITVLLLWHLWQARNRLIFDRKSLSVKVVSFNTLAAAELHAYLDTNPSSHRSRPLHPAKPAGPHPRPPSSSILAALGTRRETILPHPPRQHAGPRSPYFIRKASTMQKRKMGVGHFIRFRFIPSCVCQQDTQETRVGRVTSYPYEV